MMNNTSITNLAQTPFRAFVAPRHRSLAESLCSAPHRRLPLRSKLSPCHTTRDSVVLADRCCLPVLCLSS